MRAVSVSLVEGRTRAGCKGPAAEGWLASNGFTVPVGPNSYEIDASGVLTARLATSEFLLESTQAGSEGSVQSLRNALQAANFPKGVYPVLRADVVLEIVGPRADELFLQTCAVDLSPAVRASTETTGPVIMTSMIGVSVVLTCRRSVNEPRFTVWSDPSYSAYFHSQLQAIAAEMGAAAAASPPMRSGGIPS
jgi:sarcosine oxidase gamma subunit